MEAALRKSPERPVTSLICSGFFDVRSHYLDRLVALHRKILKGF